MTSHTPAPGEDLPLPEVYVGGGNEVYDHVIVNDIGVELDNLRRFVQGRDKDDSNFKPAIVAIDKVIDAIDGPTNKQACKDFVGGLIHCPNKVNHLLAFVYKECMDFYHNYSADDNEKDAKDCGERLTDLLLLTIGTDNKAHTIKQALLLMTAVKSVKPFEPVKTIAAADHSNFLVYGASNLLMRSINLINANPLRKVSVTPNGKDPITLDPEVLLVPTFTIVRKMVFTMSINGKYLWMKRKELGGLGGFDFLQGMLFDKYIPASNIEDTTKTGRVALLNGKFAHYVMDIQCALLNRYHDNYH